LTLIARAEDEPYLASVEVMLGWRAILREQRFHESPHGRDARPRGDEQRIAERIAHHKMAMWPVKVNGASVVKVREVVCKKSAFHAVETEVEFVVAARPASDGIRPRHRLIIVRGQHG